MLKSVTCENRKGHDKKKKKWTPRVWNIRTTIHLGSYYKVISQTRRIIYLTIPNQVHVHVYTGLHSHPAPLPKNYYFLTPATWHQHNLHIMFLSTTRVSYTCRFSQNLRKLFLPLLVFCFFLFLCMQPICTVGVKKSSQSGVVNTLKNRSYVISKSPGILSKVADWRSYSGNTA